MSRHILIRDGRNESLIVPEGALPSEAQLHEALAAHPELVPTSDLGLGNSIVVGYEASLDAGRADLILLDEGGRVCIVEVKKEGNPDTRRVVAQVLDYAASLWGLSAEEFEARALTRVKDERDLATLVGEELAAADEAGDPTEATDRILDGLASTLSTGAFVMAIAAPSIPTGVQRVIDYLGHRGHLLYGIEYSYFRAAGTEIFVPRVVAGPPASSAGSSSQRGLFESPETEEGLLSRLPEEHRDPVRALLRAVEPAPVEIQWVGYGFRVMSKPGRPYVLANVDGTYLWVATMKRGPLPQAVFDQVQQELGALHGGKQGKEWWSAKFSRDSPGVVQQAVAIIAAHIERVHEAAGL